MRTDNEKDLTESICFTGSPCTQIHSPKQQRKGINSNLRYSYCNSFNVKASLSNRACRLGLPISACPSARCLSTRKKRLTTGMNYLLHPRTILSWLLTFNSVLLDDSQA